MESIDTNRYWWQLGCTTPHSPTSPWYTFNADLGGTGPCGMRSREVLPNPVPKLVQGTGPQDSGLHMSPATRRGQDRWDYNISQTLDTNKLVGRCCMVTNKSQISIRSSHTIFILTKIRIMFSWLICNRIPLIMFSWLTCICVCFHFSVRWYVIEHHWLCSLDWYV